MNIFYNTPNQKKKRELSRIFITQHYPVWQFTARIMYILLHFMCVFLKLSVLYKKILK